MTIEEAIYNNQRLVYSIAQYFKNYKNKDDLYQAGYLGIVNAYNNYDSSYNCKFSTYAYTYILGEMRKLVREDKSVKVNRSISKLNLLIEKSYILLSQKYMRNPSYREIADYLNIDEYYVSEAIMSTNTVKSIDEPINNEANCTLQEIIGYSENVDDLIMLKDSLLKLNDNERQLIKNRYMKNLTQQEVSNMMNMSQVQVSRKEKKILQKLKSTMAA
ncbi:MAG: sigma-70 family RNA polymerase sigma factor [Bacilli bacterium]|nr:sigma-70 family RNA polymerase sigma factor [Bacilli bacterium]